ncbi:MAG: ABC transporter permease [Verrucomicrobiota bacterium]|nr:ABC transporter permease [Verrucomicrobiota bacterium]
MLFQFRMWLQSIRSLLLHPLRALLTVLGIFIGVAGVIWLLAIGEGISRAAQRQIEELGATTIILRSVMPIEETSSGDTTFYVRYGIRRSDVEALEKIPTVTRALKIREATREAYYGSVKIDSHLVACTPEYADALKLELDQGSFISDLHVRQRANVCVLGAGAAKLFFPVEPPLGKIIRVREIPYVVIGIMKPRTPMAGIGTSLAAHDFKNDIYIPLDTFWQRIGDRVLVIKAGQRTGEEVQLSQITFKVRHTRDVMPTADAIRRTMKKLHEKEDYALVVPLELLEQARTTRLMFMVFMGLIAAVTLIVGGIGIMNIMLATVTERTQEIGIRRALGASRGAIIRQFLAETVMLSIFGGVFGILGGLTCPAIMERLRSFLLKTLPEAMANLPELVQNVTPQIVPWSIPLAFGISVIVGIIFGLYPALRAARMDPITALRHG